eukprot:365248-Chlamydomonas_euryale.AAC.2
MSRVRVIQPLDYLLAHGPVAMRYCFVNLEYMLGGPVCDRVVGNDGGKLRAVECGARKGASFK